jgi:O-antigen/teichoic acid export membrane protein
MTATFALPLAGSVILTNSEFAMWALLSTIARAGLNFDAGGTTYVNAVLPRSRRPLKVITQGLVASTAGTLFIGAISSAAWFALATHRPIAGWSMAAGFLAVLATTLASVARSATVLFGNVALVFDKTRLRTLVLGGEALLNAALSLVLFVVTRSAWSLPVAAIVGTTIPLLAGWRGAHSAIRGSQQSDLEAVHDEEAVLRRFLVTKTVAPILTMTLTQADRWVVGIVGGASALALYEVAWRLAIMPKVILTSVSQILISDTAKLSTTDEASFALFSRRSFNASNATLLLATLVSISAAAAVTIWPLHMTSSLIWPIYAALLVGHVLHATTAPGVMILNGLGFPNRELPSLFVATSTTLVGWTFAVLLNSSTLAYASLTVGLVAGTVCFWATRPWVVLRRAALT